MMTMAPNRTEDREMTAVLDHGYVRLVESWGSDRRIIEAARMSTDGAFRGWGPMPCPHCEHDPPSIDGEIGCRRCDGTGQRPGDEKLLRYLYEHKHATPFEMAGLIIEVQAPIMVFREWHRHRTQSYNEMSGRYITLPNLFYVPSHERLQGAKQGTRNKQGSSGGLDAGEAELIARIMRDTHTVSRAAYEAILAKGVAREIARLVLPVAQYSRMRASANLRNWLAFLTLRLAPNAQWEIRQYAKAVGEHVAEAFPRTWELFEG